MVPVVGFRIPLRIFRVVLFPEPFGPTIPSASPSADTEGNVFQRPELLRLLNRFASLFPNVFLNSPGRRSRRESCPSPLRNFLEMF